MLFNSIEFLFFFLPATLAGFLLLKRFGYGRGAMAFLALASLLFYGWWDLRYLGLLLASVVFNFAIGSKLTKGGENKAFLILGVAGNLLCLGCFKYLNFFVDNINAVMATDMTLATIILPLGISFFTFQQVAYLVDAYRGEADEHRFLEYLVFVTFFPQLIAGPIVHHKSMMPQFHENPVREYDWNKAAIGLTLFTIGLFKKVTFADEFSRYASPIFMAADSGASISFLEGWAGSLSYTLQLYFDFSGYSDMAIGLGLLFGVQLPANFLSPYKAKSIIEFWRLWHITLSKFLKDYLYIPLGGNRKGEVRRNVNLMATMLLGGLWHGAGWTFVFWGGLHGLYLVVNQIWRRVFPEKSERSLVRNACSWVITMLAIVVAWVFFRSTTLGGAFEVLSGMSGQNGYSASGDGDAIGALKSIEAFYWIFFGFALVLLAPNSLQIISAAESNETQKWYSWALNKRWMSFVVVLLIVCLYTIVYNSNRISEFIYFQF